MQTEFLATTRPEISIVVPLYNEQESFETLIHRLNLLMKEIPKIIEIVLVNDGSKDQTPTLMRQIALSDPRYQAIFLSRNYGHQIALTAGLSQARATKAIMVIDGDLQDPPELLPKFYEKFKEGFDVVYAVRKKRKEGFVKKVAYFLFYRFMKSISYIDIPLDSGDFSLISRRVVDILNKMPEESRYIRGMRSWIGFKQTGLEYERDERIAGEAKYTFKMLFNLAYNGIFNFSEFPIKFVTRTGVFALVLAAAYFGFTMFKKVAYGSVPEGFTALLFVIILFSGLQLIALGLIGEYVLRIFFQAKNRPLFIIKEVIKDKEIL